MELWGVLLELADDLTRRWFEWRGLCVFVLNGDDVDDGVLFVHASRGDDDVDERGEF